MLIEIIVKLINQIYDKTIKINIFNYLTIALSFYFCAKSFINIKILNIKTILICIKIINLVNYLQKNSTNLNLFKLSYQVRSNRFFYNLHSQTHSIREISISNFNLNKTLTTIEITIINQRIIRTIMIDLTIARL